MHSEKCLSFGGEKEEEEREIFDRYGKDWNLEKDLGSKCPKWS